MYAYVMSPMYRSLTYNMINTLPEGIFLAKPASLKEDNDI